MQVDRIKYLEFIQAVVTRMAGNSFLLKGWSVTLAAALVAVSAKEAEARFSGVALIPALTFWGLDAYYLRHERLFRELFNRVRLASDASLSEYAYSLSTESVKDGCPTWFSTLWVPPVAVLHGAVVASLVGVVFILTLIRKGVV